MDLMSLVRSKKAAIQQQSGRRTKTVKPTNGRNRFRILPGWRKDKSDLTFYHDFGAHYIKGNDGLMKAVYICTDKTFGKPCAICEGLQKAAAQAMDQETLDLIGDAKASGRILMNALHLDGEVPTQPVILELSPTTFEKICDIIEEHGDILDLDNGVDILINRSGAGKNTEYSVQTASKSQPVPKTVLKELHDLDEYVRQESEELQTKALTALQSVAGVLAAPSAARITNQSSRDKPRTSAPVEQEFIPADRPAARAAVQEPPFSVDDQDAALRELDSQPATVSAGTATGSDITDEDELNSLLADLGG